MPKSDLAAQLRPLVDRFVHDLEAALTRAAIEVVAATLGGSAAAPRKATPSARPAPTKGVGRRTPAQVDATTRRILAYIEAHPGARGEQIKKALGLDKAEWLLPIQRLIESGKVTAKGERRATSYALAGSVGATQKRNRSS